MFPRIDPANYTNNNYFFPAYPANHAHLIVRVITGETEPDSEPNTRSSPTALLSEQPCLSSFSIAASSLLYYSPE
ncbi:hypothetical protein PNOK_0382500 [Pyrrhoderma noxium]|uniref:Uncharacterized protein n=1 Tax=Pyrrhoderma noxium TaxID=2282107 RepID=A0A286UNN0_9AGAM|nr:hypothetical protein PNOK_0382500 [Pyrrhoderma noxium]